MIQTYTYYSWMTTKADDAKMSSLESLPFDCIRSIVRFLPPQSLAILSNTSRRMHQCMWDGLHTEMVKIPLLAPGAFPSPLNRLRVSVEGSIRWDRHWYKESTVLTWNGKYMPKFSRNEHGWMATAYGPYLRMLHDARATAPLFHTNEQGRLFAPDITSVDIVSSSQGCLERIFAGTADGRIMMWNVMKQGFHPMDALASKQSRKKGHMKLQKSASKLQNLDNSEPFTSPSVSADIHGSSSVVRGLNIIASPNCSSDKVLLASIGTDKRLVLTECASDLIMAHKDAVELPNRPWDILSFASTTMLCTALTKSTQDDPDFLLHNLTPSGKWIASSARFPCSHRASVYALAAPSDSTHVFATGSYDGDVHIQDTRLESHRMAVRKLSGPINDAPIYSCAWDGYRCVAGTNQHGLVYVWDLRYHPERRNKKAYIDPIVHEHRRDLVGHDVNNGMDVDYGVWWLYVGSKEVNNSRSTPVFSIRVGMDGIIAVTEAGVFNLNVT